MSIRHLLLLALLFAAPIALATPTVPDPAAPPATAAGEPGTAADAVPAPPAPPPPPPQRVLLVTSLGEILLELDVAAAPKTVENFLAYARDGHYNGTIFHRVIPGLLLQAGAFTPDLQQKPSRAPVANEAGNGLPNHRGTIVAARDRGVTDSATAQFFLNLADNPSFDRQPGDSAYTAGYAVFGRVVQGMDVVDRIAAQPTAAQGPFPGWVPKVPVVIERVTLLDPGSTPPAATTEPADGQTTGTTGPAAGPTTQPAPEPATEPTRP